MITKWTPISDFDHINKVLDQLFTEPNRPTHSANTMPLDVIEQNGQLTIKASLPGIAPEQIDVNIEDNVLTITGEQSIESETNEEKIYRREIATGKFLRSIRLPEDIDFEKANATFAHGIVTISLPRLKEVKPKGINLKVTSNEPLTPQDETPSDN